MLLKRLDKNLNCITGEIVTEDYESQLHCVSLGVIQVSILKKNNNRFVVYFDKQDLSIVNQTEVMIWEEGGNKIILIPQKNSIENENYIWSRIETEVHKEKNNDHINKLVANFNEKN